MCSQPMVVKARGRPRITCSDRCRQAARRLYDYKKWRDPRQWAKDNRRADLFIRQLERQHGSARLDRWLWGPDDPYTTRDYLRTYLARERPWRPCRMCGFPVMLHNPHIRMQVCSDQCEQAWRKTERALFRYYEKFPLDHTCLRALIDLTPPVHTCPQCDKPFMVTNRRRKIYCSKRCANRASRARHPHWKCSECGARCEGRQHTCSRRCRMRHHRRTGVFCDRCHHAIRPGAEMRYEPSYNGPDPAPIRGHHGTLIPFQQAVFCSAKCRDAFGWLPSRTVCAGCGEVFYPSHRRFHRTQRYCSKRCKRRIDKRRETQRKRAVDPRLCRWCGAAIPEAICMRGRGRYCGDECWRLAKNAQNRRAYYARKRRALGVLVRLPVGCEAGATLKRGCASSVAVGRDKPRPYSAG